ncbi:MAG: EcsC family protein [Clostridia bacterium]|nr:EcsC family protein [Clostridia bacterium]
MEIQKQFYAPVPIVNQKEQDIFEKLTKQYEKMLEPSMAALLGRAAVRKIPAKVKQVGSLIGESIRAEDLYKDALKWISEGFETIEKYAAQLTISEKGIIKSVNKNLKELQIETIDEICFGRSYEVAKVVNKKKLFNIMATIIEGGATGYLGFAGIPLNLAASTFLYFRAVQLIAMIYGFDVKNNSTEMIIAGQVFLGAMNPSSKGSSNEFSSIMAKIMTMTQASLVQQTVQKSWTEMAKRGGIPLLITQLRALANASAQKALQNAGKKGIEKTVFTDVFEQIGKKLGQKTVKKAVPKVSAAIGALIDTSQMNKVLEYADIFYQKRFILEKESRIAAYLADNPVIIDAEIIDTEE